MVTNFKYVDDDTVYSEDTYVKYETLDRSNLRCSICDAVSSMDIADEFGSNFTKANMIHDRRDHTRIICTECLGSTEDALEEF